MRSEDGPDARREGRSAPDRTQRLDKWLWFARVAKTRTLAAQLVLDGKVRINRIRAGKPAQAVRPDDVLTIAVRGHIQVLRILAPGLRRGPPAEARLLYEVLAPGGTAEPEDPARAREPPAPAAIGQWLRTQLRRAKGIDACALLPTCGT